MAISANEKQSLQRLANRVRTLNEAIDGSLLAKATLGAVNISELTTISSTDLSAVPGSFATLADVQTYLSTVIPEIETRLDNIESKLNEIINA